MSEICLGRVRPVWKGNYDASATYDYYDVVAYAGGSYIVIDQNGVPAGTDVITNPAWACLAARGMPGETFPEGDIGQVLTLALNGVEWADLPEDEIPSGGDVGQVLTRTEAGYGWETLPEQGDQLPEDGTAGQVLTKTEDSYEWADNRAVPVGSVAGQVLKATGSVSYMWDDPDKELPDDGTTGQVLTKTDTGVEWADTAEELPSGGITGQLLTKTDGGVAWETFDASGLPAGGTSGQLLTKTDGGVEWKTFNASGLPESGTVGQVLTKIDGGYDWSDIPAELPETGGVGQVLALDDDNKPAWVDAPTGIPEGGQDGQVLMTDGTSVEWGNVPDELPAGGSTGQVLTKQDSGVAWADAPTEIPTDGTTSQVLTKTTTGYAWADVPTTPDELPTGGTTGQVLTKQAAGVAWADVPVEIPTSGTAGYVLTKTSTGVEWSAGPTELPSGGTAGQVLTKQSSGVAWVNVPTELPTDGTAGQVLTKTSSGVEWDNLPIIVAAAPNWYRRPSLMTVTKDKVTIPAGTQVNINNTGYISTQDTVLNILNAGTVLSRKGKDVFVYACVPSSGTAPVFVLSLNSTVPSGYTATTSRKIGGFHCLCENVGTISGHALSGYVAGDILPRSVWDLRFRSRGSQAGMVLDYDNVWKGIYLASWDGSKLVSAYGGTIADGESATKFNGETFAYQARVQGDRLLWRDEFVLGARGSNEGTNIYGSADPTTTGGHVDTASRRMVSNIGLEDCCGVIWQWGADTYENYPGSTWATPASDLWLSSYAWQTASVNNTAYDSSRGSVNGLLRRVLLGGVWGDGAYCGSRCAFCYAFSSYASSYVAARLGAEPSVDLP